VHGVVAVGIGRQQAYQCIKRADCAVYGDFEDISNLMRLLSKQICVKWWARLKRMIRGKATFQLLVAYEDFPNREGAT
jgi:hypothetical protein